MSWVGGLGWHLCGLGPDVVDGHFAVMMIGGVRIPPMLCWLIGRLVAVLGGIRCGLGVVRIVDEYGC